MKRFYWLFLVLSACSPANREGFGTADSTMAPYEDFSEVTSFTIKDEVADQNVRLFGKEEDLGNLLVKFYRPDTIVTIPPEDTVNVPGYIITDAKVVEGSLFVSEGRCSERSFIMTSRGDFVEQEYYDLLVIGRDADGSPMLRDKIVFEGSEGQSSTMVSVHFERLSTDRNCSVLKITSSSEGGDINLHRNEWIEYYIADGRSLRPILKVITEKTDIEDYEVSQDETQDTSSETREIKILESSSAGLYDLQVSYENKQNGAVALTSTEVYSFDGVQYVLK